MPDAWRRPARRCVLWLRRHGPSRTQIRSAGHAARPNRPQAGRGPLFGAIAETAFGPRPGARANATRSAKRIHREKGIGAPDRIRTCDLCLRRAALYPAELRVRRVLKDRKPRLDQSQGCFNAKLCCRCAARRKCAEKRELRSRVLGSLHRAGFSPIPAKRFTVNDLQTMIAVG